MPRHVRKGDTVMVIAGDNKGKTGEVLRVLTKDDRVLVKGLNLRVKHIKPNRLTPQGGMVQREASIHISNVMPLGEDGKATRVRFQTRDDGSKVRVAVKGGKVLGTVRGAKNK